MNQTPEQFYEQRKQQFDHLPGYILFDLARNESAEWRWRKAAVEIMLEHGYKEAQRVEVSDLYKEILADRAAKSDVIDVVETAIEAALPDGRKPIVNDSFMMNAIPQVQTPVITGPLNAGFTTENM